MIKAFFCWFLHGRYRHRTGERQIGRASIMYWGICEKCGNQYAETVLL